MAPKTTAAKGNTAKMKYLWPFLAWILLSSCPAESHNGIGRGGLRREVFFLNLEDGYFGCQVNASTDVLQLLQLSKLCDNHVDCFQGSDEHRDRLKCTNDCTKEDGTACQNGVCLDGVCHCNDGFGGCNCQVPDENECKYRPCDIFAHCTNTLGSFQCSCYPGYRGDGFHCEDINECDDPTLASRCVENAECCNLPANFLCKCKPGYDGDGEVHCEDVDECTLQPDACGSGARCINTPGNYTCTCPSGYTGDAYRQCIDVNECDYEGACGRGALCVNQPGNHRCECPEGFEGNPQVECIDVNECLKTPCGKSALCTNVDGSFKCACPEGMEGDPMTGCLDIDECSTHENPCGANAVCRNTDPGYTCDCPPGYSANPSPKVACDQTDVTTLCKSNFDCVNNAECIEGQCFCKDGFKADGAICEDVNECASNPCGPASICTNTKGGFKCDCETGFIGTPPHVACKAPCDEVTCSEHAYCKADGHEAYCICEEGWTFNPNDIAAGCVDINECDPATNGPSGRCGKNAMCTNTPGGFSCQCKSGYSGNALKQCLDINECSRSDVCGQGATCTNTDGSYTCTCPEETIPDPDPYIKCVGIVTCDSDSDCPGNAVCDAQKRCLCPEPNVGNDCRHPCEDLSCGPNAHCMLLNEVATCLCKSGFTGRPGVKDGCRDIDECATNPCPAGAVCNNEAGSYSCQCPSGTIGDPYKGGCEQSRLPHVCGPNTPCPADEQCIKDEFAGGSVCICQRGYTRDSDTGKCRDVNECLESRDKPACGVNAICKNLPGSYECQCPPGFNGNPFSLCEECNSIECQCQAPYKIVDGKCILADCSKGEKCPNGAECIKIAGGVSYCACPKGYRTNEDGSCEDINECTEGRQVCGYGAECVNQPGAYQCICPPGYGGDPYNGLCSPAQKRCTNDNECRANEKCVQPGECICPPPFYTDPYDGNLCKNPCDRFPCGMNAKCTPSDPPKCMCQAGYEGDPQHGCTDVNECINNPCGRGAYCFNTKGGHVCECPRGTSGDPYGHGCTGAPMAKQECSANDDCDNYLACVQGSCVNPCDDVPCGANAYCEPDKHAAWCRCVIGYTENKNNECVSQCEGYVCGEGAECIVSYDGPTCKCIEGFMGNPFPGGHCAPDVCSPEVPCAEPSICIGGRCKRRCEGIVCGIGAMCDPNTSKCVCNPYFIGNPDYLCMPPIVPPKCDPSCGTNAHCEYSASESLCVCNHGTSGNPYLGCGIQEKSDCSGARCGEGAQCVMGSNGVECICAAGYAGNPYIQCYDVKCSADQECAEQLSCINHQCVNPCTIGNPCLKSEDCTVERHRAVCYQATERNSTGCPNCPSGTKCDTVQKICVKANCISDRDCSLMETCSDGVCQEPCQLRNPCAAHAVCINNNHGVDCSCEEGYHGNGFSVCSPVEGPKNVCQYNEDCPPNKLCDRLNRRCINVCSFDSCGDNAECYVENHQARCRCLEGFSGNPEIFCQQVSHNPCALNPCGLNAQCENDNGSPICFCPKGLTGNPFDQCIPEGDQCQNNPCGYNTGCRVVNGQATCFCLPGYEGQPPATSCELKNQPCNPSPCGPNTQCTVLDNGFSKCTCLPGYIESPNTVRGCIPQTNPCEPNICGPGAICDANRNPPCACPAGFIGNPYKGCQGLGESLCQPGPCGQNADCYVSDNQEHCYCKYGFYGDAYQGCHEPPKTPCQPNPCGPNADCKINPVNQAVCECQPGTAGDPSSRNGCDKPECIHDHECTDNQACIAFRCQDACEGACGINAECHVEDHHPLCRCPEGMEGNPLYRCSEPYGPPPELRSPCLPSPCGQNTFCQVIKDRAVCSCLPDFQGDPHSGCRQECTINSDCALDQTCLNSKCINPCELGNVCGVNAHCKCSYHTPSCECDEGYFGNPFIRCTQKPPITFEGNNYTRPCQPSPCGDTNICTDYTSSVAMCGTCSYPESLSNPLCRPQCLCNADCPFDQACIGWKCADPCLGTCGENAHCRVVLHTPVCNCPHGLYGDPYQGCYQMREEPEPDSCSLAQCGANARCVEQNGVVNCQCESEYYGNPYVGCHLECLQNSDCNLNQACSNHKCIDPCDGACGTAALCNVINHSPVCYCDVDSTGNPFVFCKRLRHSPAPVSPNQCDPSPCGPNSRCTVSHTGYATCSCLPGFRGNPPACSPECIVSSDCLQIQTCVNMKCVNPCNAVCGHGSLCSVINHNPICTCPPGYSGDPFFKCYPEVREVMETSAPCSPSPCGPHSVCQVKMGHPVCSCQSNFIGTPPNCRPECLISQECPMDMACVSYKCVHPCPNSCGANSECTIINHTPYCSCKPGFEGDAFVGCTPKLALPSVSSNPCDTISCGNNALCTVHDGIPRCTCIQPYIGNPYSGCRPECMMNSDCASNLACINQHCRDPCPGVCGINAICECINHIPSCSCLPGYTGEPFKSCTLEVRKEEQVSPCSPSPCGPYSICRVQRDRAICSCSPGYQGNPPFCRPECLVSSECAPNLACINQKCNDPCQDACGLNAQCIVSNHNPICSCPRGLVGDPFTKCVKEEIVVTEPCIPSPCGPNAACHVQGSRPVCTCNRGMIGAPPNCRPECLIDQDCPSYLACGTNNKCSDPCIGTCGLNSRCSVHNHRPECQCFEEYEGDPFSGCIQKSVAPESPNLPCSPSPCGLNAICTERNGAGSCTCPSEYIGDPYVSCRPECVQNSDCAHTKACINNKCKNPCDGACGLNAVCNVFNHQPNCICIEGLTGDPLSACHMPVIRPVPEPDSNPCDPSPCGPYSSCREVNGHVACTCQQNYIGTPPSCRPECVVSADCPQNRACISQRCENPCTQTCGAGANCQVINHNPVCSCPDGYTGNPLFNCIVIEEKTPAIEKIENPCSSSICGPNSQCKSVDGVPACSCLPNFIGRPPNCRPECLINEECPGNLACQNEKCMDPCPGSCGVNTVCNVVKHNPVCFCDDGYTGDPFRGCSIIYTQPTTERPTPCNPSPCGANAICNERNNVGSCTCLPDYFGDPYIGCRPECVTNSDCDRLSACLNNKCINPCLNACGTMATCRVINHSPSCACLPDYSGDPTIGCSPKARVTEETIIDSCDPSPCGPNSNCRTLNGHAVCSCQVGFIGTPPTCRPECTISSECPQNKACIDNKCADPCPGTCGQNTKCLVRNHNPICTCLNGYAGDPFKICLKEERTPEFVNPCVPNPCGENSQCREINGQPACSCLVNFIGRPPNCRPECTQSSECSSSTACINQKCKNPCPGSCGELARCSVHNHLPLCSCPEGYVGDATIRCSLPLTTTTEEPPSTPCEPNPCGPNSQCREKNGAGACACLPDFFGNPYDLQQGCRRECETNDDCQSHLACTGYKCVDPCPGTCGDLAICTVERHISSCNCPIGYTGDPYYACEKNRVLEPTDPCSPSPCGSNSKCRESNGQPVCTCLPNYIGEPPQCRPECRVSAECPPNLACVNNKCADPCPNTCGLRAHCAVKNHIPICTCPAGFTGDPFSQCLEQLRDVAVTERPPSCTPSPCGPNSQCQIISGNPACSCLPNYIGLPPDCRPECLVNSECKSEQACIQNKCQDPCSGSCGLYAQCHVLNHIPVCTCIDGFTGDPFSQCSPVASTPPVPPNPCNPSPCGPNALCNNGDCECLPEFVGNPFEACRPECTISSECPRDTMCIRNKCRNPCPGTCGQNAQCDMINHIPVCSCPTGYVGDPFISCRVQPSGPAPSLDPCNPTPCGPNSVCKNVEGHAVCSCLTGYIGTPPSCRPECVVSSECSPTRSCVNNKCTDPCLGSCGLNARCEVINHSPICSCLPGQTGDPFKSCFDSPISKEGPVNRNENPCNPSPCGPNSVCQNINDSPVCRCKQNYIGTPPNCRPECLINPDCHSSKACINERCQDPCSGSCGENAECSVINHAAICTCSPGFTGNPFVQCLRVTEATPNPCEPSPCGSNAICQRKDNAGACSCIEDYHGNPYEGCQPECTHSSDCQTNKACLRNKCVDPCPGICGTNAQCSVINHIPTCTCQPGYTGDPFISCSFEPVTELPTVRQDPCSPSPCGPYSVCRKINDQAVCSCQDGFFGSPPNCKPECVVNSECSQNRACYKNKCNDPCPGTCGIGAQCRVINHNPLCSCPSGTTGDPFSRCYEEIPKISPPTRSEDPCISNPCGLYAECRKIGNQAACSCKKNYVGSPPNCRPECVVNTDCASNQACISEKCRDPCIGSCGQNADCRVQNHIPTCLCKADYTGDPFTLCSPVEIVSSPPKINDICQCGINAKCDANNLCKCLPNYFGDPYTSCRPECTTNSECSRTKACINQRCKDPCIGTCGTNAKCNVVNHIPMCSCPPDMTGNPFSACKTSPKVRVNQPCSPSPCGPNSICKVIENHAVCSCQPSFSGSPPACRPECIVSSECPLELACLNNKCQDPCPGSCGQNAKCLVINHNPICSCYERFTGDPFSGCYPAKVETLKPQNPCIPTPCGPNAECQVRGDTFACSCMKNYIGVPPNCRPECTINPECSPQLACMQQKCKNPCEGICGINAQCSVVNHNAVCSCIEGYRGDPFSVCQPVIEKETELPPTSTRPCSPSPCGVNTYCRERFEQAVCECLPDHRGDPYVGCYPECLANNDCPNNLACLRHKCIDPCDGTCGIGALCSVSNHVPVCSCPYPTTGDAFTMCKSIEGTKSPENPCLPNICGPHTTCENVNGRAMCRCLPGLLGDPGDVAGCHPECVLSSDCPSDKTCVNFRCKDPCLENVCGIKATCRAINHSPLCSCPAPLVGNPFEECYQKEGADLCNPNPCASNGECRVRNRVATCVYPECIVNSDCGRDKACFSQKCRDPCIGACGINSVCRTINHKPVCSCPSDFMGNPHLECQAIIERLPQPECTDNSDCTNDKTCHNQKCVNPCTLDTCGQNSQCHVQLHRAVCVCEEGYTGNPHLSCRELGCRGNDECPFSQACVNSECIDACLITQCGSNALCKVDGYHKARCYCQEGYFGNPYEYCERPECTSDNECAQTFACIDSRCINPCNCPDSAQCHVINHRAICKCPPGYTGDAYAQCVKEERDYSECKVDADCPSKLACFDNFCKNPCEVSQPCVSNAKCSVIDTLPMRTMICECPTDFVGDATSSCVKVDTSTDTLCRSNDECPSDTACLNRRCVSPCLANPCSHTAECRVENHRHICECAPGYVGDPYVDCNPDTIPHPECRTDSDCPFEKACINGICQNPCMNNRCGLNAECVTMQHHPTCHCQRGLAGNPQVQCFEAECKADHDCPYDKACRNNVCVTPCLVDNIICGRGAECKAVDHQAQCLCPAGTQGDARIACTTARCQYNEDCADHEVCERFNRVCRPACDENSCAEGAVCQARSHQPRCHCRPGTFGNPFVECIDSGKSPAIRPECTEDNQCPSTEACINAICQDPCTLSNMCSSEQECRVLGTVPVRTMICQCPPETVIDINGKCKKIVYTPECTYDDECRDNEKCMKGNCIDACHVTKCGFNAQCKSAFHNGNCMCPSDHTGNPHVECTLIPTVPLQTEQPECYSNDDCREDRQCMNSYCTNPCIASDVCGPNALCHVDNHYPICKCPNHYMGDPKVECIPPAIVVECRSNSDCSGTESCFNGLCISPCNCGSNAKCTVSNHYPSCVCVPGYSGNPQIGCVKVECESDTDCPYSDTCYNNQCINPCILENRCVINAECIGRNHRAHCKCNSGYIGNAEVLCERAECSSDHDCPSSLACRDSRCINPCINESPCARNANCYVANHIPSCRCPEGYPRGNPFSYCELRVLESDEPECRIDTECPSQLACINEQCVEPCPVIRPCLENAKCHVLDTFPVRTMVCTCPSGWITDSAGICQPIQLQLQATCTSDNDCVEYESCINRQCRDPCNCGPNAICQVKNHRAICSCESGYEGNPEIGCHGVECSRDTECSQDKACVNGNCVNPCLLTDVCGQHSECYVDNHAAECRCRAGYHGDTQLSCKVIGCYSNSDCPSEYSCINMLCVNPCLRDHGCAHRSECHVRGHLPVCRCPPHYRGNPYVACEPEIEPECKEDCDCPEQQACLNNRCQNPCAVIQPCYEPSQCNVLPSLPVRTMVCVCPSGYISSGSGTCKPITSLLRVECKADSECPPERACINAICKDPCACGTNAICNVIDHKPICSCITGYDGNPDIECVPVGTCRSNDECPGTHACINHQCLAVCAPSLEACGKDAECYGLEHRPICECPLGYSGNPAVLCTLIVGCRKDTDCPSDKACINERCESPCTENPCSPDSECHVYNHVVECACPAGYVGHDYQHCIPVGCRSDEECPSHHSCINRKCVNPCEEIRPCGINAECTVLDTLPIRTMTCDCLPDYRGNAIEHCEPICQLEKGQIRNEYGECVCPPNHAKNDKGICIPCYPETGVMIDENGICRAKKFEDFKKSMSVKCLSDGVLVTLVGQGEAFNGIIYVKHYSSDEECRRDLKFYKDQQVVEEFKVAFGTCGLSHVNGVASFTLVIQRHKKLMTYNAQAYSIKCLYQIGEQNITLGFNVSMMTTAGTIANTGPPPTCRMKIVSQNGNEISQAEIGDGLRLQVDVSPTTIYGGFARSCVAKTTENEVENEYVVTDENGCATDPTIFGEWEQDPETQTLMANFNAFKFPSSDNIRFQCNIRVCFGRCQPVNCRGYNAYGRKKRDTSSDSDIHLPENIIGDERGNINVTSNSIVTIERREDRFPLYQPNDPSPRLSEDVCISTAGFVISLIITALLALVAVAIAVSCWLIAYRRQPKTAGPLPHPPEFPNPLFTTESVAEPSPDYYIS